MEIWTAVYCTDCKYFELKEETPTCEYDDICELSDCEDSKPYLERPMYKEIIR